MAFETALRGEEAAQVGHRPVPVPKRATAAPESLDPEMLVLLRRLTNRRAVRRLRLALFVQHHGRLSIAQVMERFHVSRATAKRDIAAVRDAGVKF
jgi:Fic family protein